MDKISFLFRKFDIKKFFFVKIDPILDFWKNTKTTLPLKMTSPIPKCVVPTKYGGNEYKNKNLRQRRN